MLHQSVPFDTGELSASLRLMTRMPKNQESRNGRQGVASASCSKVQCNCAPRILSRVHVPCNCKFIWERRVAKKTKKDIVLELAKQFELTQVDTKKIVQGTLDTLIEAIAESGRIELRNFGVFEVRLRKARKARNPKTGEEIEVPAKFVIHFKAGRKMEERVAKNVANLRDSLKQAPVDDEEA